MLIAVTGSATADFTTVMSTDDNNPADNLNNVLNTTFGSNFATLADLNTNNDTNNVLSRIDDFITSAPTAGSETNVAAGGNVDRNLGDGVANTDQFFRDTNTTIQARAVIAGASQNLRIRDQGNNTTTNIFTNASPGDTTTIDLSSLAGAFTFERFGTQQDTELGSSDQDSNDFDGGFDDVDAMVSFFADQDGDGLVSVGDFFVFAFEDRLDGQPQSDSDFNDLVFQFTVVPLPHPAALAGLGLLGVIGVRRLRRA